MFLRVIDPTLYCRKHNVFHSCRQVPDSICFDSAAAVSYLVRDLSVLANQRRKQLVLDHKFIKS